ncbi:MAG: 1-deoxy-D-xylulose-5-phosphate synthase [Clostridiales bacterium]|nr:1-deoxy-D-xylulose-5-phosphate synthase [Clostridiales bacterium]
MDYPLLRDIHQPDDVKKLHKKDLKPLAEEIRAFMVERVSQTGGHIASSLGAVELILAMHRVFDLSEDSFIFDVGHQAYAHKILTGRKEKFHTLRQEGGLSGFPKREESIFDAFDTGHASTSVSAAVGMARAKKLRGESGAVVALAGDGALTGGLIWEAFNDLNGEALPLVVILNDNGMSISKNVGAINRSLSRLRTSKGYVAMKRGVVRTLDTSKLGKWLSRHLFRFKNWLKHILLPNLLFEEFGFVYIGTINGHKPKRLEKIFARARDLGRPVLVHCITQKGRGYEYSEEEPERFHGIAPFSVMTGKISGEGQRSCAAVFGDTLVEMAGENENIVAITAAMASGTGLSAFAEKYPDRFFDVGIAEEHAVTMAAGMAVAGLSPVLALYSSFLQRAFDELLHDVCLQNLPVVIALDRSGLVGEDGETHQGIYDPLFLSSVPNLAVYSPSSQEELSAMLRLAVQRRRPAVVRYNRGILPDEKMRRPIEYGRWEIVQPIAEVNLITSGTMLPTAHWIAKKSGYGCINARFLQPLDTEVLEELRRRNAKILVIEENVISLGQRVALWCNPARVECLGIPVCAVPHATVARQREWFGLTEANIERMARELAEGR